MIGSIVILVSLVQTAVAATPTHAVNTKVACMSDAACAPAAKFNPCVVKSTCKGANVRRHVAGVCVAQEKTCNDGNPQTTDICDGRSGACTNLLSSCNFECTVDAQCDDHNPCTTDSCDLLEGCKHDPIVGCNQCQKDVDCIGTDDDRCTLEYCQVEKGICGHAGTQLCLACNTDADCGVPTNNEVYGQGLCVADNYAYAFDRCEQGTCHPTAIRCDSCRDAHTTRWSGLYACDPPPTEGWQPLCIAHLPYTLQVVGTNEIVATGVLDVDYGCADAQNECRGSSYGQYLVRSSEPHNRHIGPQFSLCQQCSPYQTGSCSANQVCGLTYTPLAVPGFDAWQSQYGQLMGAPMRETYRCFPR